MGSSPKLPTLDPGTRTVVAGRTGSGKTTLAKYLIQKRSRQHWAILNPKHTEGYKDLPDALVMQGWNASKFDKAISKHRFVVINFAANEIDADFMDGVLNHIHNSYEDIGIACDELYTLHTGGKQGPGLTAVLTRGRERRQTFLGLMQRPCWVSRFCFSEADYIVGMALNLEADRKTMVTATGRESFIATLPKRQWQWYNVDADTATIWGPVPLH